MVRQLRQRGVFQKHTDEGSTPSYPTMVWCANQAERCGLKPHGCRFESDPNYLMINLTCKYLLMIEPQSTMPVEPINDRLTEIAEEVFETVTRGNQYRGSHECICGERSGSWDLILPNGVITNSLMVHYIRDHHHEVPETETHKLREFSHNFRHDNRSVVLQLGTGTAQRLVAALYGQEMDAKDMLWMRRELEDQLRKQIK